MMRDPYIHVERNVIFTHQMIRELIADAVGLAADAPKTVTTGCGKRRAYVMTSADPDKVTCLACREHAASEHQSQADNAMAALDVIADEVTYAESSVSRAELIANRDEHLAIAERFRRLPNEE